MIVPQGFQDTWRCKPDEKSHRKLFLSPQKLPYLLSCIFCFISSTWESTRATDWLELEVEITNIGHGLVPGLAPVRNVPDLCCVMTLCHHSMSTGVMGAVIFQSFSSPPPPDAGGVAGGHGAGQGEVANFGDVLRPGLCSCHGL